MSSWFEELKRRNVLRVGAAYLIVAWLVVQVVATIAPILELPAWVERLTLVPAGIKRESELDQTRPQHRHGRTLDFVIIGILLVAVAYFVVDKFIWQDPAGVERQVAKSIAILPFTNLSREEANEPFTAGIHDDLLTHISRISSIRSISRTSVLQYADSTRTIPEIARELNVATVLEGGVQRSGNRVRINTQLIDASTDESIWAGTYDRELTAANVFAIQSEIATAIADALRATLTPGEQQMIDHVPTQDIAALETYFIGKRLMEDRTTDSLLAAVEYFEKVVELDPEFALAWSGLADAWMLLPEYSATIDRKLVAEKSDDAIRRALELNPEIPEVINSEAWNRLIHHYDWRGAEETFRRALRTHPNNTNVLHWISHVLSWQGQHEEALEYARRAVAVDPLSRLMKMNLVYILVDAGEYEEALSIADEIRVKWPDFTNWGNLWLHELRAGRPDLARETIRSRIEATGGDAESALILGGMFIDFHSDGVVGNLTEELIQKLNLGSNYLGEIYAHLGDRENTLTALEEAAAEHSGSRSVLSMRINPAYDFIRGDPRFKALLKQTGL
jgi:TolB-like protein/Tfp pilus assembly protein PilF